MTDEQKRTLLDMQAFIQFALDKDLDFMQILATLGHDTTGLIKNQFKGQLLCPRTAGYHQKVYAPYVCSQCKEEKTQDEIIVDNGKQICIECAEDLDEKKIVRFSDGSYAVSGSDGTHDCGDYVAIYNPGGGEIGFWDHLEWKQDPVGVMGAIINAMAGIRKA